MLLQIGLGNSLIHTRGPSEQAQTILTEALTVALRDLNAQLRILLILSAVNVYRGEYARGAAEVERAAQIAHRIGDMSGVVVTDRRMGTTLLTMGRLSEARQCLERAIRSSLHLEGERSTIRWRSGDRPVARAMLARALWLQGFSDAARREAQASLDELGGSDLAMCRVVYFGIGRIAPMTGDFDTAENAVTNLTEAATRTNTSFWMTAGQFLRGKLLIERRVFAEGLAVLRDAFEIGRQTGWRFAYPEFTGSLALALAGLGQLEDAHDAVTGAIESAGGPVGGQRWYVPELLRIQGEILLQRGAERVLAAEGCLDQAAAMAREQGALSWELRIALSLCRLRLTQGRGDEGRQELASVYDRFTEGFDTADLVAAKGLLQELRTESP
jgi:tetratricopeptide (TPR) repeat protein